MAALFSVLGESAPDQHAACTPRAGASSGVTAALRPPTHSERHQVISSWHNKLGLFSPTGIFLG